MMRLLHSGFSLADVCVKGEHRLSVQGHDFDCWRHNMLREGRRSGPAIDYANISPGNAAMVREASVLRTFGTGESPGTNSLR